MSKKTYAGYVHLKPINGIIFPSYAQNQMYKDFITKNLLGQFYMTTNENMYGENSIILKSLIKERNLSGIVFLSTFCLPEQKNARKEIYKLAKKNNKKFFFMFEDFELNFNKDKEANQIEEFLLFDNPFFTKKKTYVDKHEKIFLDKDWKFI